MSKRRITEADLENMVLAINEFMGTPNEPWSSDGANVGNYHTYSWSNYPRRWQLHQHQNKGGGVRVVLYPTATSKREFHTQLEEYLTELMEVQSANPQQGKE